MLFVDLDVCLEHDLRVKWSALIYISCKQLQTQTVAQSATLLFRLHCTGWQVASDDCNLIFERNVSAAREGSPSVQFKQPATQILRALLLQERRWDRPLDAAHFATVKCQLIQQFVTIQVTKFAIRSVRWIQRFSLLWPDLLDIRRVAITEGCSNQESMPCRIFCTVECQIRID